MSQPINSIARQVSMTGAVAVAAVLLVVSLVVGAMLKRSSNQQVETWVGDKAASLVDAMQAMDDIAARQTQRSFGSFRQDFGPSFTLDEATGDLRDWGPKLNGNFTQVDKFAAVNGGVATVFAAKGDDFERGPWHLGRWSRPIGIVAVTWVGIITILFMLPQVSPVTGESFNYAPVAVLVVLGFSNELLWLAAVALLYLYIRHGRTRAGSASPS